MGKSFLYTSGILALVGFTATGCVRSERYDDARTATKSLQGQLVDAQSECNTATTALAARDRQLAQATANLNALQGQYDLLDRELDAIDIENNILLTTVTDISFGPLPIATQQKLSALAATYPNDMWFNAETGMIRFGSDFTFSSGKASLRKSAADLISNVAAILNSPEAEGFEIVVVGHTDDVQPKSSAQRYPTNWELSTARAVSVASTLTGNGVDPARFEVAGYGEYRPLVPNTDGGTSANRRVEIYLRPTDTSMTWDDSTTETATVDSMEEPMK